MVALQNLSKTNKDLETVQNRINTGLAVASAKDNGGVYAIAQAMRGDVGAYNAVNQSLGRAKSVVDVALAAGESVSDLLVQMKEKVIAASDASLDTASRDALNEDFVALRKQIDSIVSNAGFNGVNLINTASGFQTIASADGSSKISVNAENLSLGSGTITISSTAQIATLTTASTMIDTLNTSIANTNQALARLGSVSKRLDTQMDFTTKVKDALTAGIGNLVDADLSIESARLQALQVKQQLGIQALSIANSAPSTVLGLFR
jgi:flagellin